MDSSLTKVRPQCNSRAVCKCGYAFPSKRKAQSGNAMKRRRVHKASVRASETSQKTLCREEMDRVRRAGKRASETHLYVYTKLGEFCQLTSLELGQAT